MDLLAVELIKRVKYRYLRCLDQKRWDDLAGCFTRDATAAYGGGAYTLQGRDDIVAFLVRNLGRVTVLTSHRCHQPEIDIDAARARGTWAFDDVVIDTDFNVTVSGAGFYTDEYEFDGEQWRISHTGYRRTYEQIGSREGVEGLRLSASWWATDGRSDLPAE